MTEQSFTGKLLVATPVLEDPNFHRTVVLLVAHHPDEGALGVVLNRPSELDVSRALPEWGPLAAAPTAVFAGGPVTPEGVLCLGRAAGERTVGIDGWEAVAKGIGVVDLNTGPETFAAALDGLRIFAGHSGWGAGQLEAELETGGWFVVDMEPSDALTSEPAELWRTVLERQPPKVAMFAKAPPHLSLN